jgi:molybdopterin synthase catalytic subunit
MDFIKKEAELWKKDIEVSRRENIQLKKECEEFRKEYE